MIVECASRLRRLVLAVWRVAVATVMPLLAGVLIKSVLVNIGALTADMNEIADLSINVGVFAAFLTGLGRALLSPKRKASTIA